MLETILNFTDSPETRSKWVKTFFLGHGSFFVSQFVLLCSLGFIQVEDPMQGSGEGPQTSDFANPWQKKVFLVW